MNIRGVLEKMIAARANCTHDDCTGRNPASPASGSTDERAASGTVSPRHHQKRRRKSRESA